MELIKLVEKLSNASGASGFEDEVIEILQNASTGLHFQKDAMKNLFITFNSHENASDAKKPIVMIDAHSDEVSFMVQFIEDNGLIRFLTLGSWISSNIPAHLVEIKTVSGEKIAGITGSKPPHFMSEREKNEKLIVDDLFIDIGAVSKEDAINNYGINIGDPIVPLVLFNYNEKNKYLCGKAFDNRLGCAAVLKSMEALSTKTLPVKVVGAIATQEEVGLRGAKVTAHRVKPDLAIVFEGSPSDDRFRSESKSQCQLGKGPQIRHRDNSMITCPSLIQLMKKIALDFDITIQSAVRSAGGTNGGSIHLSENGVPTIVIGIPTRYIHTHYSYCHEDDLKAAIDLVVKFVTNLTPAQIANL